MHNSKFPTGSSGKPVARGRLLLFRFFAIMFPFVLLIGFELFLRLVNYGYDLSIFIEYKGDHSYLTLNPDAAKKYFINQEFAPTGNREIFKKKKDPGVLRLFVLGESTTIGYPYFHNGSFSRWLQYRLMHTFPDRNFEVINLSLTAVNSYTVLDFAREIVKYEPDGVLIYSGHNEYYGTLGVASTNQISGKQQIVQLMLGLRQLRITQLLSSLVQNVKSLFGKVDDQAPAGTLMRRMVANQHVAYNSVLYNRGINQFALNMDATLHLLDKHHIPVFLSNLISNEKDLKPFVSAAVDSIRYPAFKKNYDAGIQAMNLLDFPGAYNYFQEANRVFNAHALCNFYLGRISYLQNDFPNAKDYFERARDLDQLRFRASGKMNEVISKLCKKYSFIHLVDAKAAFDSISDKHIIGNELMLEHVHPNLKGYAVLSDVFYQEMKKDSLLPLGYPKEMSFEELYRDMPITVVDSLTGSYKIAKLESNWPFTQDKQDTLVATSKEEKLAYGIAFDQIAWPKAMNDLYDYYRSANDFPHLKKVAEGLLLEHPTDTFFYQQTAEICGKMNDLEGAAFYFKKSFGLSPSFSNARKLFVIYLKLDKPVDAEPFLDYAIQNNSTNLNLLPIKKYTQQIIQLQAVSAQDSANIPLLGKMADGYIKMGNRDGAAKYVAKILLLDSQNKDGLTMLKLVQSMSAN